MPVRAGDWTICVWRRSVNDEGMSSRMGMSCVEGCVDERICVALGRVNGTGIS